MTAQRIWTYLYKRSGPNAGFLFRSEWTCQSDIRIRPIVILKRR
jgi:hypothetical protein